MDDPNDPTSILKRLKDLETAVGGIQANPLLPDHYHNGFDASRVRFVDIFQKKFWVFYTIPGTNAATAANYDTFFIAPAACYVNNFQEVHSVLGTDGAAVTLMLEKLTGTTAPGSGVSVLNATLSLKATINTVQTATLTTTTANKNLVAGDRLALKKAGTLTSVANVSVMVELIVI